MTYDDDPAINRPLLQSAMYVALEMVSGRRGPIRRVVGASYPHRPHLYVKTPSRWWRIDIAPADDIETARLRLYDIPSEKETPS